MRKTLYLQMLYLINAHRTWVIADDARLYDQFVLLRRGRFYPCVCRVLRLRATCRHGSYECGTVWRVPEYELDRALAQYRRKNIGLRRRLHQSASYLEAKDVEAIVETATHGLVRLELTELPTNRQ